MAEKTGEVPIQLSGIGGYITKLDQSALEIFFYL